MIEVLEIVGVVDGSGNYKKKRERVRGRAQRLPRNANQNIDSAGLLRFLIGVIGCQSSR